MDTGPLSPIDDAGKGESVPTLSVLRRRPGARVNINGPDALARAGVAGHAADGSGQEPQRPGLAPQP
jgi:hypothetical protein